MNRFAKFFALSLVYLVFTVPANCSAQSIARIALQVELRGAAWIDVAANEDVHGAANEQSKALVKRILGEDNLDEGNWGRFVWELIPFDVARPAAAQGKIQIILGDLNSDLNFPMEIKIGIYNPVTGKFEMDPFCQGFLFEGIGARVGETALPRDAALTTAIYDRFNRMCLVGDTSPELFHERLRNKVVVAKGYVTHQGLLARGNKFGVVPLPKEKYLRFGRAEFRWDWNFGQPPIPLISRGEDEAEMDLGMGPKVHCLVVRHNEIPAMPPAVPISVYLATSLRELNQLTPGSPPSGSSPQVFGFD